MLLTALGSTDVLHALRCSFDIYIASLGAEVSHYYTSPAKLRHELEGLEDAKLYWGFLFM
jgi:hypothetical protein